MSDQQNPVVVNILDKEYRVACEPSEEAGLAQSARILDERMREIRQAGRVIGVDRIAVMAALNFVYELMQLREQQGQLDAAAEGQLARIQDKLDAVLAPDAGVDGAN